VVLSQHTREGHQRWSLEIRKGTSYGTEGNYGTAVGWLMQTFDKMRTAINQLIGMIRAGVERPLHARRV